MKNFISTRPAAFDTVLAGRNVCIDFDRVTVFSHDAHYGADADGRRGWPMTFIDDDYADSVRVEFFGNGAPTGSIADVATLVSEQIDAYLERTEPEPVEDDESDRWDYDKEEK